MSPLQVYENMKAKAKKALSADKVERFKTGGGVFQPTVDAIDEQLIALMRNRAVHLQNQFDSDNGYADIICNNNNNSIVQVSKQVKSPVGLINDRIVES
jgi:hypothetical protein